ncbi:hypothetical protein ABET23_03660 [Bacillus wiedmannii]|uniref:hypothetical protein n=1 Tax=Bacillus wiedmannii TaxID=1890302 RepID=UPI003D2178E3
MSKINNVVVSLDENVPEYMEGIIRVGSAEYYDADGKVIDESSLDKELDVVDNTEFHSETELKEAVAKRLGISPTDVDIE